jgi:hypothetical protein
MMNSRSRRCHIAFETLEKRLALSGAAAAARLHGAEVFAHRMPKKIPIALTGQVSVINGATITVSGVTAKLGKVRFSGTGSGTLSGRQFEGGSVLLSNASGGVTLLLGTASAKHAGKNTKLKVTVTAENGTGGFVQLDKAAGSVNLVIPDKAGAASSFKGTFNKFNSAAAGDLGF